MWKCKRCGKAVYFAERKTSLGYDWHPECLRCEECGKRLNPGQHAEHKGEPYCHIPCYSALFGPTLFGHGSKVEAHTSFGKVAQRSGQNIPRSHLEAKLKLYNQHQEGKSTFIQSRERNGRLILEGSLKIYWGINQVIHLKEDHDDRMPVRRRNSCRIRSDSQPRVLSFPKQNSSLLSLGNEEALNQLFNLSTQETPEIESTSSSSSRMYKTLPLPVKNRSFESGLKDELEDKENDEAVVLTGELADVALRKQPGRKRYSKLKRRCSINGHFYNRETSTFTPSHGIMTSIWVTSLVTPSEVINMLLDKFKVKNKADDFCLVIVFDSGEQRLIHDNEYPLLSRVLLGPNEDVAKVFIMEKTHSLEISSEVAQFINLSVIELQAFINKYDEEERREETKIRQKFMGMRYLINRRLKQMEQSNDLPKRVSLSKDQNAKSVEVIYDFTKQLETVNDPIIALESSSDSLKPELPITHSLEPENASVAQSTEFLNSISSLTNAKHLEMTNTRPVSETITNSVQLECESLELPLNNNSTLKPVNNTLKSLELTDKPNNLGNEITQNPNEINGELALTSEFSSHNEIIVQKL